MATEPPKIDLLNRPPQGRDEYILSKKMVKHIAGQALYCIAIVYAIAFGGENFFPEPEVYWRFDKPDHPFVYPGRLYDYDRITPLWETYNAKVGSSRQMTNVFNVFVVMQIFNMINARKINDEFNVFEGFFRNPVFAILWFLIFGAQALIVEVGSRAFKVSTGGLHYSHWIIALGLGVTTWILSALLKLIPDKVTDCLCPCFGKSNKTEDEVSELPHKKQSSVKKEGSGSLKGSLRGAFRRQSR